MTFVRPTKRVTQAMAEALDIEDAKRQLRITHSSEDSEISRLITSARIAFESAHEHTVMQTEWEMSLQCFPTIIEMRWMPVISITSIKYTDVNGVEQTVDPADYTLKKLDVQEEYIELVLDKSWPSTYPCKDAVRVRYQAGYADAVSVPEDIKVWMKDLITYKFMNKGDDPVDDSRMKPSYLTEQYNGSAKF